MDGLIPWKQLVELIRPFYPKAGWGRRPYALCVMLRIHCVQAFYNLSEPGMEEMLYEVESVRPGRRRQLERGSYEALMEKRKALTRAKEEHPFLYVKRHFGYAKVRYRGLAKNTQRLALLLGMTNLIRAERYLAA